MANLVETMTIKSFKSIVEATIPLGRINVLIGANGSGKSNVLEAIGILSAAAYGRVDAESLKRRGVRPGVTRLYKSAFGKRLSPHIYFEMKANDASYSASLNNTLEDPRPAWLFKTENLWSGKKKVCSRSPNIAKNTDQGLAALKIVELPTDDPAVELMARLRDYAIYSPNTLMLRGLEGDPQSREPVGLSGGRLAEAVGELKNLSRANSRIEEALDEILQIIDWVDGFDAVGMAASILSSTVPRPQQILRFSDRYMRKPNNRLTAYDASEGALYVLFCAVLALSPNAPRLVAVDNLDQALNPRLLQRLVQYLCKWVIENPNEQQLLFTAHNPAVLDGLPLDDDRVRLFTVDRNNLGYTLVKPVVITEELRRLHQTKGWPLSRLWVMGHLGGVPNV